MKVHELVRKMSVVVLADPIVLTIFGALSGGVFGGVVGVVAATMRGGIGQALTGGVTGVVIGAAAGGIGGFVLYFVLALAALYWAVGNEAFARKNFVPAAGGIAAVVYCLVSFAMEPGPIDFALVAFGCVVSFTLGAGFTALGQQVYRRIAKSRGARNGAPGSQAD